MDEKNKEQSRVRAYNKSTIDSIHHQHEKARSAVKDHHQINRDLRDEQTQIAEETSKRKADEDALILSKRQQMIKEQNEHEKIPISKFLGYDATENGGHGLMNEMSVAELRERIVMNKSKLN